MEGLLFSLRENGEQVMSFSSASSASLLGQIAVDLASKALEEFLEDEEMQKAVAKTVAGSVTGSVTGSSQATSEVLDNLNSFLGDSDEEV
ncbi:hypothetical protein [Phormidesmis priestleyi]